MGYETIILEKQDRIATITFNRPKLFNAYSEQMTHELKTPIASIRLYLETLQRREVDEGQRREFYQSMLVDTERLMSTVELVLKAGALAQKKGPTHQLPLDFSALVGECVELARTRHHLDSDHLEYK